MYFLKYFRIFYIGRFSSVVSNLLEKFRKRVLENCGTSKAKNSVLIVKLFCGGTFAIHLLATTLIYVGYVSDLDVNWITVAQLEGKSEVYIAASYFVVVTITTIGYGELKGVQNIELVYMVALQLMGVSMFSIFTGLLSKMFAPSDLLLSKRNEAQITLYLMERAIKEKKMPNGTGELIEKSFEAELRYTFKSIEHGRYFSCLPPKL